MDSQYVIQRTNIDTGEISYLSPGRVNWVTEEAHKKYRTRYGKWVWGEAEEISRNLNIGPLAGYKHVPLPASKHL